MKIKILCGVSGSGKTTYARSLGNGVEICSADSYFEDNGEYMFEARRLPEAHAACLRRFVEFVTHPCKCTKCVVVDNTNTTIAEIAPYAALALAYGYDLEILVFQAHAEVAAARNVHSVPFNTVAQQAARLRATCDELPPWWKVVYVNA